MKISDAGLSIIKRYEGLRLTAYICPAGVPTIGYGSTQGVKMGECITEEEADRLLIADIERICYPCIEAFVEADLTQPQFDALCSWIFNLGCGAFKGSTFRTMLNSGNIDGAVAQMKRWDKGGGKVLPGLVKRRHAEAALFLSEPVA